jgi:hypothetical protein
MFLFMLYVVYAWSCIWIEVGGKVKVKISLTDPKAQTWVEIELYSFFTLELEGVGRQHHSPAALLRERPGAGLDV